MLLDLVEIITWAIAFLCMYFTVFWFLVFIEYDAKDKIRKIRRFPLVSIIIPAYNEERSIATTLDSVLGLDYPAKKLEIIVVNDGSSDATVSIVRSSMRRHANIRLISQRNQGKGVALNRGLDEARGEFFVCLDADSFIEPDALRILLPEFDSPNVASVLPLMKARGAKNWLQKFQATEYVVNIFYKKLMASLDCVHVSPGPFSVYRTAVLRKVGGFDIDNLTEDLEMTVRLQKLNYKIKQNMNAVVWTLTPERFSAYVRQRKRWFKGGLFNAFHYREMLFNKRWGDFGLIQLPILIISGIVSVILLLTSIYSLKPMAEYLWRTQYIGFDFMTLIQNLKFDFAFLDLNIATLFIAFALLCISLAILYFSHVRSRERLFKHGKTSFALFIFFYFFLLGFVWLEILFVDFLFGKKQRW